jgi:predicted  nucleic acid-binding Zn-ribbon protein
LQRVVALVAEVEQLRTELAARTSEHAQAVHHLHDLQGEVARLQGLVRDLEERAAAVPRLEAELQAGRQTAAAVARERDTAAEQRDHLGAEVQSLRAQVAEISAQTDHLRRLAEELDAVRAERDHLEGLRQAEAHTTEQLRARMSALERSLAEVTVAPEALDKAVQEARARWEAAWQEAERSAVERWQREIAALRQERDAALQQITELRDGHRRAAMPRATHAPTRSGAAALVPAAAARPVPVPPPSRPQDPTPSSRQDEPTKRIPVVPIGLDPQADAQAKKAERRKWVRYPCNHKASCRLFGTKDNQSWPAQFYDVSPTGVGLLVCNAFARGAILAVKVQTSSPLLARPLIARVKNCTALQDGTWLVGCAFVTELTREQLADLLAGQ